LAALGIVLAFRHPLSTALTISASLAQIGEFSFILAGLGLSLQLLPEQGHDLILAGALLSITLNPLLFVALDRVNPRLLERERRAVAAAPGQTEAASDTPPAVADLPRTELNGHAVLVGHGRVGRHISADLKERGVPFLVIDENEGRVARLKAEGIEIIVGKAGEPGLLEAANLAGARWLISAIPNPFEASSLIEVGREANPDLIVFARAHSDAEVEHLRRYGAHHIVLGEQEIAREMMRRMSDDAEASLMSRPDPGDDEDGDAFEQARRRAVKQEGKDDGTRPIQGIQARPSSDAPG
jgi:CPA2 family monovalent cation:H+ antiporter-2